MSERLAEQVRAEDPSKPEAQPAFVLKGTASSGQPLLLINQQGSTVARARSTDEIVEAVAALVASFAVDATGAKFAARLVRRPEGSITIVEPWPGHALAGLTPRLSKADFNVLSPIEYGIEADGRLALGLAQEPATATSMLVVNPVVDSEFQVYLAAARICLSLITTVAQEQRSEVMKRIATLAEGLTSTRTVDNSEPAPLFEALTS